jgi:tetratricopeptide (TPR) repeat protein
MKPSKKHRDITVFYSYASADKEWRDQLANHLIQLKRDELISEWYDQQILAGSDRTQTIDKAIHSAHLILLLVSADFLASDTCYQIEMRQALERHRRGEARVVPIILRPCDWQSSQFAHLQYLPRNGQPIATWHNRDEAFVDVVAGIRNVIEDFLHFEAETSPLALPLGWTIPYRQNPFFTGREQILTHLHEKLRSHKSVALTQPLAISGLGGIGKTQTAIEYAYRYRDDYALVLWVRADTLETLTSDFATIANLLNLTEKNAQNQHLIVSAVKNWLEASSDWLLILDNADDLTFIQGFLPTNGKGHILLTTRARPMGKVAQRVEIDKMEMEEAVLFVLRRADIIAPEASLEAIASANRVLAHELVTLMDGLPLALDQAGAYIEETGTDLSRYLKLYKTQRKALLKRRSKFPTDHPEPVASTWLLSFQKIEKRNSVAADLLRFCAFLQPDAIPEELLTEGAPELGNLLEAIADDPLQLDETIGDLLSFSLVRRHPESKTLSIHRLVQVALKDEMDEQTQRSWAERVIRAINRAFPKDGGVETWPDCQRYLPQALVCAGLIEQWNILLPEASRLLRRTAVYLYFRSQYEECEALFKLAVAVGEQVLGRQHPETAQSLFDWAWYYWSSGRDDEVEGLFREALTIQEQMLGPEHVDTARILNDLARLYVSQGKYEQVEPMIKRALAIYEWELGPMHPRLTEVFLNLAELYLDQDQYEQAEQSIERVLVLCEQEWEIDSKANMLDRLACLYMRQKKYEQAEPLVKQVLKMMEKVQELDPRVAQSLNSLADIYTIRDEYEQAEQLRLRALKIWEQIMGQGNGFAVRTREKLAQCYMKQRKHEQAMAVYAQVISLAPNDAKAYLNRGYVSLYLKRRKHACEDFAKYASLQPENVNAAWMVVYASLNKQRPGIEIAETLEMIATLDPQCCEAYACRGVALELRGKLQEGLTELEHALHLDAESEDALFWKGMICAYLGRDTMAVESIEQALQAGLPPILLTPLCWLEQDCPKFYQEYAEPLLKRYELT